MTTSLTQPNVLQKPLPSQIDVCGLTHRGHVRSENADHFLIASFHRAMQVHNSSIPTSAFPALSADSRGYVFLVADGVGAFAQAAACVGGAEKRRACGRARKRAPPTDLPRLSERRERSERSELCGAIPHRAA